jgi:phage portal protein BeeE
MKIFGLNIERTKNASAQLKAEQTNNTATRGGDIFADDKMAKDGSIFKGYIPTFLYKPPFGYPRSENIPLIKAIAKNPYIHAVITALQEEAAWNKWEIVPVDDYEDMTPEKKEAARKIKQFLNNPNMNQQGFSYLVKCAVRDICEIDSGVWVKVFNKGKDFTQLTAIDGGSILMNPDIHGNIGNRVDVVQPTDLQKIDSYGYEEQIKYYNLYFKNQAAYFQYGWTVASLPVPFGKREIIYFKKNPRSDNIYGVSPVMVLTDILLTLIYGARYNLDFYLNSNMPEGIIKLLGAQQSQITAFSERLKGQMLEDDQVTGFKRKVGYKLPVTNVDADFIPFQFNSKDMQILEQQAWFTRMVWMAFGLQESDLGIMDSANRASSQTGFKQYTRKAVRPILELIAERINQQLIPEFGDHGLMFKWDDYDLDEDIKRHQLYQLQLQLGIKTSEMIANEEHIDIVKLKQSQKEAMESGLLPSELQGQKMQGDQRKFEQGNYQRKDQEPNKPHQDDPTRKPAVKSYDRDHPTQTPIMPHDDVDTEWTIKQREDNQRKTKSEPFTQSSIESEGTACEPGAVTPTPLERIAKGEQLGVTETGIGPRSDVEFAANPEYDKGVAVESKEHPEFDEMVIGQLVRDHLAENSHYYSDAEVKKITASMKAEPAESQLEDNLAKQIISNVDKINMILTTFEKGQVNNIN